MYLCLSVWTCAVYFHTLQIYRFRVYVETHKYTLLHVYVTLTNFLRLWYAFSSYSYAFALVNNWCCLPYKLNIYIFTHNASLCYFTLLCRKFCSNYSKELLFSKFYLSFCLFEYPDLALFSWFPPTPSFIPTFLRYFLLPDKCFANFC